MEVLLLALTVAFNLIIILWKFNHKRYFDTLIDSSLLVAVAVVFSGSYAALAVGTIGSCIVSIYLLISPPRIAS